jgi:hypothetical protein
VNLDIVDVESLTSPVPTRREGGVASSDGLAGALKLEMPQGHGHLPHSLIQKLWRWPDFLIEGRPCKCRHTRVVSTPVELRLVACVM